MEKLRSAMETRATIINDLNELQGLKKEEEYKIAEEIVKMHAFELITVNYRAVEKKLRRKS